MPKETFPMNNPNAVLRGLYNKRFQGEWMTCKKCGAKEKSHKNKQSNWTFIQVDNGGFYVCNNCYSQETLQELLRDHLKRLENG